jgi:hypothetical protein
LKFSKKEMETIITILWYVRGCRFIRNDKQRLIDEHLAGKGFRYWCYGIFEKD